MTISLPYLWALGHLAAAVGAAAMVGHQMFQPRRLVVAAAASGGALSVAFLGFILFSIEQSFFGVYRWLSWVVAFLAGYAVAAAVVHLGLLAWSFIKLHYPVRRKGDS